MSVENKKIEQPELEETKQPAQGPKEIKGYRMPRIQRSKQDATEKQGSEEGKNKLELAQSIASRGKKVVHSYASIENVVMQVFNTISTVIDRYVFNPRWGGVISLLFAVFMYMTVNSGMLGQVFATKTNSEILDKVPVTVNANNEVYEIEGLPESVTPIIKGEISDLQMTKSQGGYLVVADLSGLGEGTHAITLSPNNFSSRVQVFLNPSTAVVTIKKKISWNFDLGYDFINSDKMDARYVLGTPTLDTNEVTVRASQQTIDSIAFVKALINVEGVKETFEQDAVLAAYDQNGNRVQVDIIPSTVRATVEVSSPNKTIPIVIVPNGELPNGKAIESISLDHAALTIYGQESVLNAFQNFIVNINVSEIYSDSSLVAPLRLPSGIKKTSVTKVNLEVKLTDAVTRVIKGVNLNIRKNINNYRLDLVNRDNVTVDIEVTGSKERVEAITADQIEAYLDMEKTKPGIMTLPVIVQGTDYYVKYKSLTDAVDVEIIR